MAALNADRLTGNTGGEVQRGHRLAGAPGPDTTYTVTFRNAKEPRHEGIVVEGETVEVKKEGTTLEVVPTGKS